MEYKYQKRLLVVALQKLININEKITEDSSEIPFGVEEKVREKYYREIKGIREWNSELEQAVEILGRIELEENKEYVITYFPNDEMYELASVKVINNKIYIK